MSGEIKNRTVYMLCRIDCGNGVYIGSTSCPLEKRFAEHKHTAGNPSTYYGCSKLYHKMREVGVQQWEIIPLLTFACNEETICEFEREWVKATGANLNTFSPINRDLAKRKNMIKYHKKNKEEKRYFCGICAGAFMHNSVLKRHLETLKHSYNYLNSD